MTDTISKFQKNVLHWFDEHGRKNLPWQHQCSPYRTWISEIMLQQTTVQTVIPYFKKFISRFPSLRALADVSLDEVLGLWSGLGYYARARNLHRCAQILSTQYHGRFPKTVETLQNLPGIGRSTAGAILSLGCHTRAVILDGNIKRLLTRYHAISGWPGEEEITAQLWEIAERYTPTTHFKEYNQALMDLGALVCIRRNPHCNQCPLAHTCKAKRLNQVNALPTPKPTQRLPIKQKIFLILQNNLKEVLLTKRPLKGIWGGLWSFPEYELLEDWKTLCQKAYCCHIKSHKKWPVMRHTFTHFRLEITPIFIHYLEDSRQRQRKIAKQNIIWYNPNMDFPYGLPTPIQRLLEKLKK